MHSENNDNGDGRVPEWLRKLREQNKQEQRSLAPGTPFFDAAAMGQTTYIAMPGGIVVVNKKCPSLPYC